MLPHLQKLDNQAVTKEEREKDNSNLPIVREIKPETRYDRDRFENGKNALREQDSNVDRTDLHRERELVINKEKDDERRDRSPFKSNGGLSNINNSNNNKQNDIKD